MAAALCAALFAGCGEKGAGPSGIRKEEFDKIWMGMDNYELLKLIGGNGDRIAEDEMCIRDRACRAPGCSCGRS